MIKFPQYHIATSVTNRILNARDALLSSPPPGRESGAQGAGAATERAPVVVPDPATEAIAIDESLAMIQPGIVGELGAPGSDSAQAFGSIMKGGTALNGLINARTLPQ